MQHLRLCMFLASIAVLKVSGTSKRVLDFCTYVSGDFDNKEQIQKPGDDHAFIQFRVIPVDIKCLRLDPVLFVEHAIDGVISILALAVVKDGFEGTVSVTIYNLADYTRNKPGEFNVEKLSNISCGDLQGDEDCIWSFRVATKGVIGIFPQFILEENGKHPRMTLMYTCASASLTMPMGSWFVSPGEHYEFLKRQKYPLINPPTDYMAPCGN